MPKYLVFNPQDNRIDVRDEKPSDCTTPYKNQSLFGNLVPVWHTSADSVETVAKAVKVFTARQVILSTFSCGCPVGSRA